MHRTPIFAAPFGQDHLLRFFVPLPSGFGPGQQAALPMVALEDLLASLPVEPLPRDHITQIAIDAGCVIEKAETEMGAVTLIEVRAARGVVAMHLGAEEEDAFWLLFEKACLNAVTQWGLNLPDGQRRALWATCQSSLVRGGRSG